MLDEQNSYFRIVVRDAIYDLKNSGGAVVFSKDQVDEVIKGVEEEVQVKFDENFYYLNIDKKKKDAKENE